MASTASFRARNSPRTWSAAQGANRQAHARLHAHLAAEHALQGGVHLVLGDLGHEAQRAQVDAQDRDGPRPGAAGHREQRPVAAQDHHQIGAPHHLRTGSAGGAGVQVRGVLVQHEAQPALLEPLFQAAHETGRLGLVRLHADADGLKLHGRASGALTAYHRDGGPSSERCYAAGMGDDAPDLFARRDDTVQPRSRWPIACGPRSLDEVAGQDALVGAGAPLRALADAGELPSLILWGPPGCGKTTLARLLARGDDVRFHPLSAVTAGVADVRDGGEAGAAGSRDGPALRAVPGRDPSLQPRPAGRAAAPRGGRHA